MIEVKGVHKSYSKTVSYTHLLKLYRRMQTMSIKIGKIFKNICEYGST